MRLEEKIHQRIKYHTGLYKSNLTKEISELAGEFAISFANWYDFMLKENDNLNERFTARELLEIFKKEKGL